MKNALIDPRAPVLEVIGWTDKVPYQPITQNIPNSARVAEVVATTFEVAPPLFWTSCADNVVQDQFYYDTVNQAIYPVPPSPPYPSVSADQPSASGAQTL
jgi:hypothetical protein